MQLLRSLDEVPRTLRGGAVSIGNFDGVHLGHARLIERLRAMARKVGGPSVVFTFDPPPVRLLRPEAAPEPLLWLQRKIDILAELDVDATLVYPTDRALLELNAREFFDQIVRGRLGASAMVEGPNFFFGHNRSGNVAVLRQLCDEARMPFEVTEPMEVTGQIVSSSRIRSAVLAGRVDEARTMLGRPYRIRGVVVRGAGRGARLGYPTANIARIDTLLPAEGIYAARARTGDCPNFRVSENGTVPFCGARAEGLWHPAAVSLGPNPTFDEGGVKVEAHLLDFRDMIYDRAIEVDFLAPLRQIKRFDSVEALLEQMGRDVVRTVEIVAGFESGDGASSASLPIRELQQDIKEPAIDCRPNQ